MRDLLFQGNRYSTLDVAPLAKKLCGTNDEIIVASRQGRIIAGELNSAGVPHPFDRDPVRERNRRHERFNFVKTIGPAVLDPEGKIDFCRRRKLHILQFVQQAAQNNRMKSASAEKIIVALDVATTKEALRLASLLADDVGLFKIGLQNYTAEGPALIRRISFLGPKVFLDLKLHDIPNTVA